MRGGGAPAVMRLAAAFLVLSAPPVHAQSAAAARMVRRAHDAQRHFESIRRNHLPWTWGGSGGHCDARIGRFCYWHTDTPDSAPPEPTVVVRARRALLATLDSAARVAPSDGWIAGQRVRYWIEAGFPDSALAAVTPCGAAPWWCDALRGLALHEAARFVQAGAAFDAALAEMPDSVRCRWTDLHHLLDGRLADRYSHFRCDERTPVNARLWWLARPFYSRAGNDRRTAHFARRTMIRIAEHSVWPETLSWGDDLTQLVTRYGWSRWFERVRPDRLTDPEYSIVGHGPDPSYAFFPDARAFDSSYAARPDDWNLHAYTSASRYAPAYATWIDTVPMLLSRFARGDSEVIVAAYDASGDTLLRSRTLRAAAVMTPGVRQQFVGWNVSAGHEGAVSVAVPRLNGLAGIELFDDSAHAAARNRRGLAALPHPAAGTLSVSDLLLFRPTGQMPHSLSDAAAVAVARPATPAPQTLGIYWEVYDTFNTPVPFNVSLTVARTSVGWWQRARRFLHLGGRDTPIALRWQDVARSRNGMVERAVAVDLSRLAAGTYEIRLQVKTKAGPPGVAARRLDIRR